MRKTSFAMEAYDLVLFGGTITLASEVSGREFVYLGATHPSGRRIIRLLTNGAPEYIGLLVGGEFRLREAFGFPASSLAVVAFEYFWTAASWGRGLLPAQLSVTVEPWLAQAPVRRRA